MRSPGLSGGDAGDVHQRLVAGGVDLRGDDRAVRRRDHRRPRQPSRAPCSARSSCRSASRRSTRLITNANPSLPPNLLPSLQWVAIGLLIAVFLWLRPQGVLPERRRIIRLPRGRGDRPVRAAARASAAPSPSAPQAESAAPLARADVILQAVDVSRDFGGVHAVSGVSLRVARGTVTGLIGPNGAGKSTLLALLAGTDRVSGGQICTRGRTSRRARLPAGPAGHGPDVPAGQRVPAADGHGEPAVGRVPATAATRWPARCAGRRYWRRDEAAAIDQAAACCAGSAWRRWPASTPAT